MKKNDKVILTCNEVTTDGYGKVYINDNIVFVKGLLTNEEAEVLILKNKKNISFGKILKLIKYSDNRNFDVCDVYQKCGGCNLQHFDYHSQLELKTKRVQNVFRQIAKMDVEVPLTIASEKIERYRNKVQIPCKTNKEFQMGFYRVNSNDIVPFNDCIVQSELSNNLYFYFKESLVKYNLNKYLRHILIKHAHNSNQLMIVFIANTDISNKFHDLINDLLTKFKVDSIILNINESKTNVILGEKEILLYGNDKIIEHLGNFSFEISSKSFYQINPYQTLRLYNDIVKIADLKKEYTIIDLYSGVGTIGIFLANFVKKVIAVEYVKEAVLDARRNALNNNIYNIDFINDDASNAVTKILKDYGHIDVVVVDPPRKGLTIQGIETIVEMKPNKIIYISCDPATLARDIKEFVNLGYNLKTIQPYDMFPHTDHVESIILMTLL